MTTVLGVDCDTPTAADHGRHRAGNVISIGAQPSIEPSGTEQDEPVTTIIGIRSAGATEQREGAGMVEVTQQDHGWVGLTTFDVEGTKVGKVADVYLDRQSRRPDWALLQGGLLGTRRMFVPLTGCHVDDDGMHVAFAKGLIEAAPAISADGSLTPGEEASLYSHYGLEASLTPDLGGIPEPAPVTPVAQRPIGQPSDGVMVRSEEELQVSAVTRPSELVRLRKYVVTEDQVITVPVRREEIRIERIPFTDDMAAALPEGALGTELGGPGSAELVLLEEQVVVTKRVVARERVRLEKDVVTEERIVSDQVRKERIDVEHQPITE